MRTRAAVLALGVVACNGPPVASQATDSSPAAVASARVSAASAAASWPTPPDYDLDADIRLRTALAQSEFPSSKLDVDVEDRAFLILARHDDNVLDEGVSLARDALGALYNGRFSTHPARAVTVYVFKDRDVFNVLCRERLGHDCVPHDCRGPECETILGVYIKETREIFVDQEFGSATLVHELVHPLIEAGDPGAPRWLREGISALFEKPEIDGKEIHGATNWRLQDLRAALDSPRDRELARLDALFAMPDDLFDGERALVAYSVARFACQWMDSSAAKHGLWRFFQQWRGHRGDDPTGEKSFVEVFGQTPREANAGWQNWVRSL